MTFPKGTTVLKAISHSQGKQILIFPVPSTYLQESTPGGPPLIASEMQILKQLG